MVSALDQRPRRRGFECPLAAGCRVATAGQLLFVPRAWAYSPLHPLGVGKWVPAIAGKVQGRYVRRCLVRAMYLSTFVVAVSTWGAISSVRPLPLPNVKTVCCTWMEPLCAISLCFMSSFHSPSSVKSFSRCWFTIYSRINTRPFLQATKLTQEAWLSLTNCEMLVTQQCSL